MCDCSAAGLSTAQHRQSSRHPRRAAPHLSVAGLPAAAAALATAPPSTAAAAPGCVKQHSVQCWPVGRGDESCGRKARGTEGIILSNYVSVEMISQQPGVRETGGSRLFIVRLIALHIHLAPGRPFPLRLTPLTPLHPPFQLKRLTCHNQELVEGRQLQRRRGG